MVTCENDGAVFGHIIEVGNVNTAKKSIDDDADKPIDKALKHVTNPITRERLLCGFGLGLSTRSILEMVVFVA